MSELLNEVKNEVIDIGGNVVKEPIVEDEGNWTEMDTGDLCNMFGDYIVYNDEQFSNNFQKEDFDYEVFNADYYAEKFPAFDPEVHEILARVSQEKIIDLRKKNDTFKIISGSFNPFEDDIKRQRDKETN
jgi:hypothetical protein